MYNNRQIARKRKDINRREELAKRNQVRLVHYRRLAEAKAQRLGLVPEDEVVPDPLETAPVSDPSALEETEVELEVKAELPVITVKIGTAEFKDFTHEVAPEPVEEVHTDFISGGGGLVITEPLTFDEPEPVPEPVPEPESIPEPIIEVKKAAPVIQRKQKGKTKRKVAESIPLKTDDTEPAFFTRLRTKGWYDVVGPDGVITEKGMRLDAAEKKAERMNNGADS